MKKTFYITTAIAYTSRKPHIGNTYDPVLADAIARYKRMRGYEVFFLTGSDEHGLKIEQAAREQGISPKAYVDGVCAQIRAVWDTMNVSYDRFIRTTDEDHVRAVGNIFEKLYQQGDIYKGRYEGKYCVPCESFFTPSQLKDGRCPDCGREVTDASEEAYFLRLSKYQDRLLAYYEEHPDFFLPASRRHEMINNFLKPGLSDLCVSRTSITWGIPVRFDPQHVTYVWLDALSNYITGLGFDPNGSGPLFDKFWPADLHVIGKDIVRFHTIYWPIILMALGLPLPKQVLGHPWLLFGDDKMSKSKGNVLYADDLAARFGTDAVRYYLLSEIPFAQDGGITYEKLIARINTDLANTLGNLVNRSIAMAVKYFDGRVTRPEKTTPLDAELRGAADAACTAYASLMDEYRNADAADAVMTFARRCNKYIDETTPWLLAKNEADRGRLEAVLYHLLASIRTLGVLLAPFMPQTAQAIFTQLGIAGAPAAFEEAAVLPDLFTVGTPAPLFARIDGEKLLAQLAAEQAPAEEPIKSLGVEVDQAPKAGDPAEAAGGTLAANIAFLSEIAIDDFARVDLRVATVIDCEPVKKSKKLLKLTLDDGSQTPRTVCSGIAAWYTPQELKGRQVVVVANLKPAVLCGVESQGMILAADDGDRARVLFVDGVASGARVR